MLLQSEYFPISTEQSIEKVFLQRWGFDTTLPMPFEGYDLEKEKKLNEVYVNPPYFESIVGGSLRNIDGFKIIYADRGFGKSSLREIIRRYFNQKTSHDGQKLYIPLLYDRQLQNKLECNDLSEISIVHHFLLIISIALKELESIYSSKTEASPINNIECRIALNIIDSFYCKASQYLLPQEFISKLLPWYRRAKLYKIMSSFGSWAKDSISSFLSRTHIDTQKNQSLDRLQYKQIINCLDAIGTIILSLGFKKAILLVDEIDENRFVKQGDDSNTAKFIKDLVNEPYFQSSNAFAVRCFLPISTRTLLKEKYKVREDKSIPLFLEWKKEDIYAMLKRRLMAYSKNRIVTLNTIADGFDLDSILVSNSSLSPRCYGQLGHIIFTNHFEQVNTYLRQNVFSKVNNWDDIFLKYKKIQFLTVEKSIHRLKSLS